jgi:hypothetical protein
MAAMTAERVPWLAGDDHQPLIDAIKAWVREHPGCTLDDVIAGLGLPDMTGIPEDPKERTAGQQRAAALARDALQHAGYVIRTYGRGGAP